MYNSSLYLRTASSHSTHHPTQTRLRLDPLGGRAAAAGFSSLRSPVVRDAIVPSVRLLRAIGTPCTSIVNPTGMDPKIYILHAHPLYLIWERSTRRVTSRSWVETPGQTVWRSPSRHRRESSQLRVVTVSCGSSCSKLLYFFPIAAFPSKASDARGCSR